MDQDTQVQNYAGSLFRKLGFIIPVLVFLLPLFFVPGYVVGLHVAKNTLLVTGLVAMFMIFLASLISNRSVEIPKVKYLIPLVLFGLVALISSIFTGFISTSIAGDVFDVGSSGSILVLIFSMLITFLAINSQNVVSKTIRAFIYSGTVLVVYTMVTSLGSNLLPTKLVSGLPVFITGGLVDTAVILGAVVIFALCALNMSEVSRNFKYLLTGLIVLAVLFVGAAGFQPVIVILGLVSLIFLVYVLSWSFGSVRNQSIGDESGGGSVSIAHNFSFSSLIILCAMVILILGGSTISGYLSSVLKINSVEIRPDFETTMNLTVSAWKQNFAFGIGPNRFVEFWSAYKPTEINQSQFWSTDFYNGSGFVPTIAITTGLLGLVSILSFVVLYLFVGIKAVFAQANSSRSRYLSTSSFLVSFYFWIMLFLYSPSIVVLALTFIFTGMFTATLVPQGVVSVWKVNIFANPKTNFVSILAIVLLLILSVSGGYLVWKRSVASVFFNRGMGEYATTGNTNLARSYVVKSINLVPQDVYWRGLAELSVADLNKVLSSLDGKNQITDSVKVQAQSLIGNAIESAKRAVDTDRNNFQNWFALGRVYEILAANGVEGALENARLTYQEAGLRSANNPAVPLALARLDVLANNFGEAREKIKKSLELKSNYVDAYYTLAQIEAATNNIAEAIRSVEAITIIEPNNPGLYFQLGLLRYNKKDFLGAASAFERAVLLAPEYANAKYFLGISYYQLNRRAEAVKQFEEIKSSNPNNQEVEFILSNMKAGKSLFADAKPPLDSKPEKREEPPIKEKR